MTFSHPEANWFVPIALFGWPLVVLLMFVRLPARTAVLYAFIVGFLFLPEGSYVFQGFPEYGKFTATSYGTLLATIAFDGARPFRTRLRWFDLPMLVWCFSRIATSLSNGLGLYDGLVTALGMLVTWGIPYWLGRTYFADAQGARELARGIVIGGLLYMPLCWYELRFSPQLHTNVYGFLAIKFFRIVRYESFRPIVFTQGSLLVAMWMATATLMCAWLVFTGNLKTIWRIPGIAALAGLAATTLLCQGTGASSLMIVGLGLLFCARSLKLALPLAAALLVVASYPILRGSGILSREAIGGFAAALYEGPRVQSLDVRLASEDLYIAHTAARPLLGWGGWGRAETFSAEQRSIPDGLWVIALSRAGWLSLAALMGIYLLPVVGLLRRYRAARWCELDVAPGAALASVLVIWWVDCLSNAMLNLVLILMLGAANGFVWAPQRRAAPAGPEPPEEQGPPEPVNPRPKSLARGLARRRGGR